MSHTSRSARFPWLADDWKQYSSAHIDRVESEVVVRSSHSTQGRPETIEEVRRILRLHAGVP